MSNNMRGYLYAAVSSSSYGINAFAPLLYAAGITTGTVLFYRYFFAVLLLFALMFLKRESFRLTKKSFGSSAPWVSCSHTLRSLCLKVISSSECLCPQRACSSIQLLWL